MEERHFYYDGPRMLANLSLVWEKMVVIIDQECFWNATVELSVKW